LKSKLSYHEILNVMAGYLLLGLPQLLTSTPWALDDYSHDWTPGYYRVVFPDFYSAYQRGCWYYLRRSSFQLCKRLLEVLLVIVLVVERVPDVEPTLIVRQTNKNKYLTKSDE
jgi:hypothetical protein